MKHRHKPKFRREDILTAQGLLNALLQLFPDLRDFPDEQLTSEIAANEANHHSVLHDFLYSFHWAEDSAEPFQINELAKLVQISLGAKDEIENAWMTCFWEHRPRRGPLWTALSPETKRYIKAN